MGLESKLCICGSIAKSGVQCIHCNTFYHNSCHSKVKTCCGTSLLKENVMVDIDFSVEAYGFLKDLVSALKRSNSLLMEKIAILEAENVNLKQGKLEVREEDSRAKPSTPPVVKPTVKVGNNCNSTPSVRNINYLTQEKTTIINQQASNTIPAIVHLPKPPTGSKSKNTLNRKNRGINECSSNESAPKTTEVTAAADSEQLLSSVQVDKTPKEQWSVIVRKNRFKNNSNNNISAKSKISIIGNSEVNAQQLKAAPRKAFLYVSRLAPATSSTDISNYLKKDFVEVECEDVISKYPQHYTSFKVSINLTNLEKAMNPNMWPKGTYVTRFFHGRRASTQGN